MQPNETQRLAMVPTHTVPPPLQKLMQKTQDEGVLWLFTWFSLSFLCFFFSSFPSFSHFLGFFFVGFFSFATPPHSAKAPSGRSRQALWNRSPGPSRGPLQVFEHPKYGSGSKPKVPFWGREGPLYSKGFWDVHRGTGVLTHCHIINLSI